MVTHILTRTALLNTHTLMLDDCRKRGFRYLKKTKLMGLKVKQFFKVTSNYIDQSIAVKFTKCMFDTKSTDSAV